MRKNGLSDEIRSPFATFYPPIGALFATYKVANEAPKVLITMKKLKIKYCGSSPPKSGAQKNHLHTLTLLA